MSNKYSINDFVYWLGKYNDLDDRKWSEAEMAALIAHAMVNFFPDTNTPH